MGNIFEINAIEKAIFERRSVRNFKDKPVPEALIQRVLEAGRFAPSAGNCQPWRFIVITDKALIKEIGDHRLLTSCSCEKGFLAIARGSTAHNYLTHVIQMGIQEIITPYDELNYTFNKLRKAQELFQRGDHHLLYRGELIKDIPRPLRRWLIAQGRLKVELDMM